MQLIALTIQMESRQKAISRSHQTNLLTPPIRLPTAGFRGQFTDAIKPTCNDFTRVSQTNSSQQIYFCGHLTQEKNPFLVTLKTASVV